MTFIIPSQTTKKLQQPNNNDLLGNLYVTKNINLDQEGYIKLSGPAVAIMTTDDDADFLAVDSMHQNGANVWIPSQDIFTTSTVGDSTFTNRSADTNAPFAGYEEASVYFNGTDVVSSDTVIKYRSGTTTWTTVSLSLDSSYPTSMAVFDATAGLMVGNKNIVKLINSSWATAVTLTLPVDYIVTSLVSVGDVGYIATRHSAGGEGKFFTWNGTATSASGSYGFSGTELYSVKEYDSTVVGITSLGQLVRFTGGGFTELASLPVYFKGMDWSDDNNDHARVSDRGLAVDGDVIYIRLDPRMWSNKETYNATFVGGLWVYDKNVGLYCKNTPSYTRLFVETINTSAVNTTTDVITTSAYTVPVTGTPMVYYSAQDSRLKPLRDGVCYYIIKTGANTMKVASSYVNALAGTAIDLTSTGSNTQQIFMYFTNDYGWSYPRDRGAVSVLNTQAYNPDFAERMVMTAQLWAKQNVGTQKSVFNVIQPNLYNRGYFVTPKLSSPNIQDTYPYISFKFNQLGDDDKIVIKYRTVEKLNFPVNIQSFDVAANRGGTWTSTSTFTSIVDLSDVVAGDEIEIVAGVGAGFLAHVSSITESSGTYTVTLDESFIWAVANDVMYFVVDNWTKLQTIESSTPTSTSQFAEVPLIGSSNTATFVQFKVELRGIDVTLSEVQVTNKSFKKVV